MDKVRLPFSSIDHWLLRRFVLTLCTGCYDTLRTGLNNRGDWHDTLKNHKLLRKDLSARSLVVRLRRMRGCFTRVARDVKRYKEFGWMSKRVICCHVSPLQQTWWRHTFRCWWGGLMEVNEMWSERFHCFTVPFNSLSFTHQLMHFYTECHRRNGPNFGRVFLMLKYTDITQNTYIQSWTVTEIMAREVWNFDNCYTLTDCQIHIETGRNMWFL